MQKVFILVLLLSLLHRPSAQNISVSPITAALTDPCTTSLVVSTNEVAIDYDPRTLYGIDMCLFYNHPTGQPFTYLTPCPGVPRKSTYELDVLSGEPSVKKTYTETTDAFTFSGSTQHCIAVHMTWFASEYANQDFNNFRVKARITVIGNLNGGSVVAAIRGGRSKLNTVGIYPAFNLPRFTVHTVLCHDVPHCIVTAETTGDVYESRPVHLGIVSNYAPVYRWGPGTVVNSNTFLAKSYRCFSSDGCTVAITVTDGTPKTASGGPQN